MNCFSKAENHRGSALQDIDVGKSFQIGQWNLIGLKSFCVPKGTVN